MTMHYRRRSWWRLGIWRCACGKPILHPLTTPTTTPLPDGETIRLNGYRQTTDILNRPANNGRWTS